MYMKLWYENNDDIQAPPPSYPSVRNNSVCDSRLENYKKNTQINMSKYFLLLIYKCQLVK